MKKKLLIVVDVQNDFVSGSLGTKEAQEMVPRLADFIKETWDGDIIFTQDTHYIDYLETQEGKRLPVKHCIKDTWGWEIVEEVQKDACLNIEKNTFGYLGNEIKYEEYDEIYFCGLCTDICVIANVIIAKTKCPETPIFVYRNFCAGVTPETHNAALKTMEMLQVTIL